MFPYEVAKHKRKGKGYISYDIGIPSGSVANVSLPLHPSQKIKLVKRYGHTQGKPEGLETGIFKLGEGEYLITAF
jgi:hypothetical protein